MKRFLGLAFVFAMISVSVFQASASTPEQHHAMSLLDESSLTRSSSLGRAYQTIVTPASTQRLNTQEQTAFYGAPYYCNDFYFGDCGLHADLDGAIQAWWVEYKRYWGVNDSNCSYYYTLTGSGGASKTFVLMYIHGTACGGGPSGIYGSAYSYDPNKNNGEPDKCCSAGDPINLGTGNEFEDQEDYDAGGPLQFHRYYNSNAAIASTQIGSHWRHSFDRSLEYLTDGTNSTVTIYRPDGKQVFFEKTGGVWTADPDVNDALVENDDASGNLIGWTCFVAASQQFEHYNADGLLTSIEDLSGQVTSLAYSDGTTPPAIAPAPGLLITVTDPRLRQLNLTYDSSSRINQITLPDGSTLGYGYDTSNNLSTVTYPDSSVRTYKYNESGHVAVSMPNALTGILDENTVRYADIHYDSSKRATSSQLGNTIAADLTQVSYNADGTTKVTYPLGVQSTFGFAMSYGKLQAGSSSTPCSPACSQNAASRTYDANGNPLSTTDFKANTTAYTFNNAGLETQRIEAHGTSVQRTTNTQWDDVLRNPLDRQVLDSNGSLTAKTSWTYNVRGQVLARCDEDPTVSGATSYVCTDTGTPPAGVRRWVYTYCDGVLSGSCPLIGLLLSANGPRTDVSDITTYTYYQTDDATCASAPTTCPHRKGDLWKVTNALGQVTETLKYDGAGRVLSIKDSNGITTDFEYHPRGWLTARKVRGINNSSENDDQITGIEYWPTGLVKKVTQPDGSYITYIYDDAHRLTDAANNAGNTIHYTLDDAGNRENEETKDPSGILTRALSRDYNQLGQLQTQFDAQLHPTGFTYDDNGNPDTVTDALGHVADNDHDPLNRLKSAIQDLNGIAAQTQFEYDALDNLTKVTDPKGLDTTYAYDGLSDLKDLVSPDTGATHYEYDKAGNRLSQMDAKGVTATYSYDALNRLTGITYPTTSLNVGYVYDTPGAVCQTGENFGKGRLAKITDATGSTSYCYGRFGDLLRKVQVTNSKVFTVRYGYDRAGHITSLTYPDGTVADYVRDGLGSITETGLTRPSQSRVVVVTGATYAPFGPSIGWAYPGGRTLARPLDLDYRPAQVFDGGSGGGLSLSFGFNDIGNLDTLQDGLQSQALARYHYDGLNRLDQTQDGPTGTPIETYVYNTTGDRLSTTVNPNITTNYAYPAGNHRLFSVGGVVRLYDANGNTTSIGGTAKVFRFNDANRMDQAKAGGSVLMNYAYNGKGEQVRRYLGATNSYTVYDEAGHWLGDYDGTGAPIQQTVWMDDLPVGLVDAGNLYYIEPDHLGTPRTVIDPARNVTVWRWDLDGEAFGNTAPNQDPDLDSTNFVFNLRYPGQRYDSATGLNYNYFRDYDPNIGRYVESDPVGLLGGWSTYAYVGDNSLSLADPFGLASLATRGTTQRRIDSLSDVLDTSLCDWWPASPNCSETICVRYLCKVKDKCGKVYEYFIGRGYPYAAPSGYDPGSDGKCKCVLRCAPGNLNCPGLDLGG